MKKQAGDKVSYMLTDAEKKLFNGDPSQLEMEITNVRLEEELDGKITGKIGPEGQETDKVIDIIRARKGTEQGKWQDI